MYVQGFCACRVATNQLHDRGAVPAAASFIFFVHCLVRFGRFASASQGLYLSICKLAVWKAPPRKGERHTLKSDPPFATIRTRSIFGQAHSAPALSLRYPYPMTACWSSDGTQCACHRFPIVRGHPLETATLTPNSRMLHNGTTLLILMICVALPQYIHSRTMNSLTRGSQSGKVPLNRFCIVICIVARLRMAAE